MTVEKKETNEGKVTKETKETKETNWYDRKEEIIHIEGDNNYFNAKGQSLFDSLYGLDEKSSFMDVSASDLSKLTLCDISEAYYFSLAYLGDYLMQIGCQPPIDVDIRLGDMLTGDQMYSVMEAINTLDPFDTNIDYDSVSARELAEDIGISTKTILHICEKERLNLPFGLDSMIHRAVADKILEVYQYDEYREDGDIDTNHQHVINIDESSVF